MVKRPFLLKSRLESSGSWDRSVDDALPLGEF